MAKNNGKQLLSLKPHQLVEHPKNMRRFYDKADVQEMAASILATGGVLEPLIVVKDLRPGKWVVVDGNMRLRGARELGDKCPPLDCKEVAKTEGEQLLAMVTANKVRYDVDPVSEAMHFKALRDKGLTVRQISEQTGVAEFRITNRLPLASLELEIQKMVVAGQLPKSPDAIKALLELEPETRVQMARKLAENPNTQVVTIIKACETVRKGRTARLSARPAVERSGALGRSEGNTAGLRKAAAKACHQCSNFEKLDGRVFEPAWSLVVHKADDVCGTCPMKKTQTVCGKCPMVDLLRRLATDKRARYAKAEQ